MLEKNILIIQLEKYNHCEKEGIVYIAQSKEYITYNASPMERRLLRAHNLSP